MKEAHTVLVVEDDKFNLEFITEGLTEKGFNVLKAENGIAALRLLEMTEEKIKVIILDWMMPEMSGLELLGLLKEDEKLKNVPVIIQTAKDQPEDVVLGLDNGAYQYLIKPFEEEVLYSMVRSAIAEFERFEAIRSKAEVEVKEARASAFRDRIRWRTP